jgi:hypothetical protein
VRLGGEASENRDRRSPEWMVRGVSENRVAACPSPKLGRLELLVGEGDAGGVLSGLSHRELRIPPGLTGAETVDGRSRLGFFVGGDDGGAPPLVLSKNSIDTKSRVLV